MSTDELTRIGPYEILGALGKGGMAAVYVAVHKIGRRDAIKILHPEVAKSAEMRARFEQEAHAVNRFKHPGAVEIRDIDVTEDDIEKSLIIGSPQYCLDKLMKYADLGIHNMQINATFGANHADTMRTLELFAAKVMPHFAA